MSLLITFLIINEFIDKKNLKKFTPGPAPELLPTLDSRQFLLPTQHYKGLSFLIFA
jgi:hypothetical protein